MSVCARQRIVVCTSRVTMLTSEQNFDLGGQKLALYRNETHYLVRAPRHLPSESLQFWLEGQSIRHALDTD
jgi:hypothetical protein